MKAPRSSWLFRALTLVGATVAVAGCGGGGGGGGGGAFVPSADGRPPIFKGLKGIAVTRSEDGPVVQLAWDPPTDERLLPEELFVKVYAATRPFEADEAAIMATEPLVTVSAASGKVTLGAAVLADAGAGVLDADTRLYFLVRACDSPDQCDTNTVELWADLPVQVLHVDAAANSGGNGSRKAPFRSLMDAFGAATGGTAILVAEGDYDERLDLDFEPRDGIHVTGGFPRSFQLSERDPLLHPTRVVSSISAVVGVDTKTPLAFDGMTFVGDDTLINAEAGELQISDCRFADALVAVQIVAGDRNEPRKLALVGNTFQNLGCILTVEDVNLVSTRVDNNQAFNTDDQGLAFSDLLLHKDRRTFLHVSENHFRATGGAVLTLSLNNQTGPDAGFECHIKGNLAQHSQAGFLVENWTLSSGSIGVYVLGNHLSDLDAAALILDTLPDPVPSENVTLELGGNRVEDCRDTDEAVRITLNVGPDRTCRVSFHDNSFTRLSGAAITLTPEAAELDGVHEGGHFEVDFHRNTVENAANAGIYYPLRVPHYGTSTLNIQDNQFRDLEEAIIIEVNGFFGHSSGYEYGTNDSIAYVNVIHNEMSHTGQDTCGVYSDDRRIPTFVALIGNTVRGAEFDDALVLKLGQHAHVFTARNTVFDRAIGNFGMHLASLWPAETHCQNELIYQTGGAGIEWNGEGGVPQITNSTVHQVGIVQPRDGGIDDDESFGDSPIVFLNSIATENQSRCLDENEYITPIYSMVNDRPQIHGFGSQNGDPLFDESAGIENPEQYFELDEFSPARDAGQPGARFRDLDGTRNDLGHTGGPGAGPMGFQGMNSGTEFFAAVGTWPTLGLESGGTLISTEGSIVVVFTDELKPGSVDENSFSVWHGSERIPGTRTVTGNQVEFVPETPWTTATILRLEVTSAVRSQSGVGLSWPYDRTFAVAARLLHLKGDAGDDTTNAYPLNSDSVVSIEEEISDPGDADFYSIDLVRGTRLQATVYAYSRMEGTDLWARLRLIGPDGVSVLLESEGVFSLDPFLDYTATQTGTYWLQITPAEDTGSYRLTTVQRPL